MGAKEGHNLREMRNTYGSALLQMITIIINIATRFLERLNAMHDKVCLQVSSATLYRLLRDHAISIEEFQCLDSSSRRFVKDAAIRLITDSGEFDALSNFHN